MSNFKTKDIIVIIISSIIFIAALVFILEGGKTSNKSKPSPSDLINEPKFISEYDEEAYNKIKDFSDYNVSTINGLCKGDLFSYEQSLPEGSICYALQQLGINFENNVKNEENNNQNTANLEETSRNSERDKIMKETKTALESYYAKNKDYPQTTTNKQVSELYSLGGVLSSFVLSGTKTDDPLGENTRMCYVRRSSTQYWLYYVAEPTKTPTECKNEDPKNIEGSVDFSVR
ncbi:MAG: hypothetical protein QXG00_06320 [Candidatus Woesearchaeota archaeon]